MAGVIATLASAALLWAGTGLHPTWWLTWLAPLPVFWFARRSSWEMSAIAAFAAWFVGESNTWLYLHRHIGIPALITVILFAIPASVFAIAVLLWRMEARRGRTWRAALWPPLVWVAYEYLNTITSPHSTFGSIAYSQMDCLPTVQLASITGIWGIVFLLIATPAVIAVLAGKWNQTLAMSLLFVLIAIAGFGLFRLQADYRTSGGVDVRLIATDARQSDPLRRVCDYASQIEAGHADITILPEKIALLNEADSTAARAIFSSAAAAVSTELIAGLDERRDGLRWNDALVFSPHGDLEATYEKHHFIPGLEDGYVIGDKLTVLDRPSGKWGVVICKDLDFPQLSRQYAQAGVGLLLAPAWDFNIDGWLHSRMAVMRGVESGFTVVRAARQGILTVSDSRGHIVTERATSPAGFVSIEARIPVARPGTFYAQAGDWFAWVVLAALLIMIVVRGGRHAHLAR
jgi:apolipoprotein N-acyltransferase